MAWSVRIAIVLACVGAALGAAGALQAYFSANATAGGSGQARATYLNQANAPTAAITAGRAVTVSWGSSTLANGAAVDGYLVTRYDATTHVPQVTGLGCSGRIAATSCTELFVPPGTWTYTVAAVKGVNWQGASSSESGALTVGAATLSLTKATLGLGDFGIDGTAAHLTGSLSGFAGGEDIAFRLDSSSGSTLTGSPTSASGSGSASVSITLPRTSDGSHTIYALGTGASASQTTAPIVVDTVAPTSSAAGVDSAWHPSSVTATLSASDPSPATGVASVAYQVDGGSTHTIGGASGAVTVAAPADHSNDGAHTLTFAATDNAGNTESPAKTVQVKIDTTPPATALTTSPASPNGTNGWFKQSSVTFTLAGTDASSGVAATFYTLDGGVTQTYTSAVTVTGQGAHTITYWSTDNAGNVESTHTTQISLDNVAPATTITTSPAGPDGTNAWFRQSTVTFTLSASDASSGVVSRFYKLDGGSTQTYTGTVTLSTQGDHTIAYWSTDNAGNAESQNTTHIKLDNVVPSTTDNTASIGNGWKTSNQTVTLTPTDATSGVAVTYATTDGSTPTTGSAQTTSIGLTTDGLYTVKYFSVDNAGNSEAVKTGTQIRIDKTAPTVDSAVVANTTSNNPGLKRTAAYVVYANASDNLSGVSTVTANVSALTSGQTAVTLSACASACTIAGVTYGYKSAALTANTTDGTKSWSVTATDAATNSSGATSFSVNVDDTAPTIAGNVIASSATDKAGFVRAGGGYYVYANVSDASPSSGIASVTASVSQLTTGATAIALATSGGPWTIGGTSYAYRSALQTVGASVTAGNKNSAITVTDNATNTATGTNFATTVDNTAPTTTAVSSPAANAAGWDNANTTVTLTGTDASAGVDTITYSATGAQPISTTTVSASSASVVISTAGTTTISFNALDNAGNVESTKTATVNLDKTVPTAGAFAIPSPIKNGQALTNAATDDLSGVAGVSYYYCSGTCTPSPGTLAGTGTTGPNYSFAWSSQPADGTYTVVARVTDVAGNSTDSSPQTTTIDNTAPTVTNVALANGGTAKKADSGDTVSITYSEALDASTFCSAWSNSGTQTLNNGVVTITQNGATDGLTIASASCTFHLGTVVPGDYVSATVSFTSSTISWDPSAKKLTITLGTTTDPSTSFKTSVTAARPTYTPDGNVTDAVGNAISTARYTDGTATGF
jgi:Bacterial Ig-like domain/Chitobiase/beta-hexosaminidase C-terminal domain